MFHRVEYFTSTWGWGIRMHICHTEKSILELILYVRDLI